MKKSLALIVLTSFLSALFVNIMPVFAADDGNLKIYYSEPIGAGEKVYHISACQKIPAYAPVVCTREIKELGSRNGFGQQCDNSDDIGNRIRGCLIPGTGTSAGSYKKIDGTSYPDADIDGYLRKKTDSPPGCSDDPDKQTFKYGKMYAFIPGDTADADIINDALIRGTAVSHDGRARLPAGMSDFKAKQLYQTGLCATWDVLEGGGEHDISESAQEIMDELDAKGVNLSAAGYALIGSGCNNNAHTDKLDPEPSASCSYVERISGTSGTSILSNYIGALYKWAAGIIGIIAVLSMVYSGIQISVAGGNVSLVEEARNNIFKSLVGLVILFLSGLILYTINPTFFTGG